jgi:hypothetical protein
MLMKAANNLWICLIYGEHGFNKQPESKRRAAKTSALVSALKYLIESPEGNLNKNELN